MLTPHSCSEIMQALKEKATVRIVLPSPKATPTRKYQHKATHKIALLSPCAIRKDQGIQTHRAHKYTNQTRNLGVNGGCEQ